MENCPINTSKVGSSSPDGVQSPSVCEGHKSSKRSPIKWKRRAREGASSRKIKTPDRFIGIGNKRDGSDELPGTKLGLPNKNRKLSFQKDMGMFYPDISAEFATQLRRDQ